QVGSVANNPSIAVRSVPAVRTEFVTLNNTVPGLDDPRVRTALAMALDRAQLLRTVFADRGSVATGPFPPTMIGAYDSSIEPLPYDPEAASRLLDEAGWTVGLDGVRQKDGQRLDLEILYDP